MTAIVRGDLVAQRPHVENISADDTSPLVGIHYKGQRTYGTSYTAVQPRIVKAAHTFTFYLHFGNSIADDTTYGLDGVGIGTAGVITVTDGMTVDEFCALVNASKNWEAFPRAAYGDTAMRSGSTTLVIAKAGDAADAANVDTETGLFFFWDTSAVNAVYAAMGLEDGDSTWGNWHARRQDKDANVERDIEDFGQGPVEENRPEDHCAYIESIEVANAACTGDDYIEVYAVSPTGKRLVFGPVAGPGSGQSGTWDTDGGDLAGRGLGQFGLWSNDAERLVVKYYSTTLTSPTLRVTGLIGQHRACD